MESWFTNFLLINYSPYFRTVNWGNSVNILNMIWFSQVILLELRHFIKSTGDTDDRSKIIRKHRIRKISNYTAYFKSPLYWNYSVVVMLAQIRKLSFIPITYFRAIAILIDILDLTVSDNVIVLKIFAPFDHTFYLFIKHVDDLSVSIGSSLILAAVLDNIDCDLGVLFIFFPDKLNKFFNLFRWDANFRSIKFAEEILVKKYVELVYKHNSFGVSSLLAIVA